MTTFNLTVDLDTFPLPRTTSDNTPLVHADVIELLHNVAQAIHAGHIGPTRYNIVNRAGVLVGNYLITDNTRHNDAPHDPDTTPVHISLAHNAPAGNTATPNTDVSHTASPQAATDTLPPLTVSSDNITYTQASPTSRIKFTDAHIDEVLEWIANTTQHSADTCQLCAHLRNHNSSAICPRHIDVAQT